MRRLLLALVALPAAASLAAGADPEATLGAMTAEEAAALVRQVQPRVEALRGLAFRSPVPVKVVTDAQAREHFRARLEELLPAERVRAQQKAYEQLGLLPEGIDLIERILHLLEEQAGGYYDPAAKTFFLLGDMPRAVAPVLMAHEMTHALDDQHYEIDRMLERALADDDRATALNAVIEGSGMVVMTAFTTEETLAGRLDLEAMLSLQQSEAGKAERLMAAPPVLQRMLMAPYLLGAGFLAAAPRTGKPEPARPADPGQAAGVAEALESLALAMEGLDGALGDAAAMLRPPDAGNIDRAFRDPPESSEQVLHPDKYWDPSRRDPPRPVALPDLAAVLGPGWSARGEGTLGELDVAVLAGAGAVPPLSLEALSAGAWTNPAASGWGGDRWVLLSDGARTVTALATVWDREEDAAEFAAAARAPAGATVVRRADAVVIVAGDAGERAGAVATAALDRLAPP